MKDETIKKMKEHENYTLLLDEATHESNRSELSLIARVVESGEIHNLFLSPLELRRCGAELIFKTIEAFLVRENLEITNVRFSDFQMVAPQWPGFIMVFDLILSNVQGTYSLHPLPQS